jgi:methylenetetrahydrofolate reductase (NADPH)
MFASRHASKTLRPQLALHALQVSASNITSAAVTLPPAGLRRRHSRSHFTSSTSLRSFSTTDTTTLVQSCLANYSIEVTPGAAKKVSSFAEVKGLAPNTNVNVTYLVGADINESLDICARLVEGGMLPVAHVPARAFPTLSDVEDYLSKLNQLGCREVLVLGGGAAEPAGELHETMQILESGLLQKYDFHKVGVAAHPEGHPDISDDELRSALLRKALWARDQNVELYYETQFCFEPEPIIAWEIDTRSMLQEHIDDPASMPTVRLGIAGPAKIANLIKFGVMSGVGNSLRFLTKYTGNIFKLATKATPLELIVGVAQHQEEHKDCMIRQLHVYPFGGLVSTLKWVNEQLPAKGEK